MRNYFARLLMLFLIIGLSSFSLAQSGRHRSAPKPPADVNNASSNSDNSAAASSSSSQPSSSPSASSSNPPIVKGEDIPGGPALKIDATLVSVPTVVSDRTGRYVPFLKAEDFKLYEDSVPQDITFFASERLPFNVALVLDTSGSIRDSMSAIQESAKRFVHELRDDDKVMVVEFNSNVNVLCELSSNKYHVQDSISRTRAGGATRLYDALYEVAKRFKTVEGRKAIILLTDGEDTESRDVNDKQAIDAIMECGALTYVIQFPDSAGSIMDNGPGAPPTFPGGHIGGRVHYPDSGFLHELVDLSGGDMYYAGGRNGLPNIWHKIAEELRFVYVLGYYPTNPVENGGFRQIHVQLRDKDAGALRYKHGYSARNAKAKSNAGAGS
jgi:VWFA-related protein